MREIINRALPTSWRCAVAAVLVWGMPHPVPARSPDSDLVVLSGRARSMSGDYHSASEWNALFADVDSAGARAERSGEWRTYVELRLLNATILSDMLNEQARALSVIQQARRVSRPHAPPNITKLYVREAEVLAKMGDDVAISRLIDEFKRSPFYDPQDYRSAGGQGRGSPLMLTRPHGRGDDSLTVTSMEVFRQQARSAAGRAFPPFELTDTSGGTVRLADYRGRVVLVDFWLKGWVPWQRDLPSLTRVYREYHKRGFDVLGINLDRDASDLQGFLKRNGMTWPQVAGDTTLARKLGVYGEAASFLVDAQGNVIGRNLGGAELGTAVRRALEIE